MNPFSEDKLYDQTRDDAFFASGSRSSLGDGRFSSPLWNKEQIKLSFPVKNKVKMLSSTSSIYYYNRESSQWNIPLQVNASVNPLSGPFDYEMFSFSSNWSNPSGTVSPFYTQGSFFTQDAIGFNAYGRPVATGTDSVYVQVTDYNYAQKIRRLSKTLDSQEGTPRKLKVDPAQLSSVYIDILTDNYTGSLQRSSRFSPKDDETFTIEIDRPFLIEKAVIDIPFCFGTGWFNDKTVTNLMLARGVTFANKQSNSLGSSVYFDRGGPVITVGLFCKKNFGVGTIMDLIASGTITHSNDAKSTVDVRKIAASDTPYGGFGSPGTWVAQTACGFTGSSAVISANSVSGQQFTGSVRLKMTPASSNGVDIAFFRGTAWSSGPPNSYLAYQNKLLSTQRNIDEYEEAPAVGGAIATIGLDVDPFGRGMTGFAPSGGSIFGGEYGLGVGTDIKDTDIKNFYIEDEADRSEVMSKFSAYYTAIGDSIVSTRTAQLNLPSSLESPYLLNPGDKLVLSISKTRPAISGVSYNIATSADANVGKGSARGIYYFTGSTGHDVQFNTGSINITLYGSYVRDNNEYLP